MKEGREKGREGEGKLSFYISMTTEVMGSTSRWGKKRLKKNPALLICSYLGFAGFCHDPDGSKEVELEVAHTASFP